MGDLRARLAALTDEQRAELRARLAGAAPAAPVPRRTGPAPASYAQRTLWFLDRLTPGQASYHTGVTYELIGPLDVGALDRAFARLAARHEGLRTAFADGDDGPVQRILPAVDVRLDVTDVATDGEADRIALAETRRPFALSRGPLWRARLLRRGTDHHVLVLVAHHIVVDGWSFGVLAADLSAFYRAETDGSASPPDPLPWQYADFSEWQRRWLDGPAGGATSSPQTLSPGARMRKRAS